MGEPGVAGRTPVQTARSHFNGASAPAPSRRRIGWAPAWKRAAVLCILAVCAAGEMAAQRPPRDLIRRIAEQGSRFERELENYTYRQSFEFLELDKNGAAVGSYSEVRDILFTPEGERSEQFVGAPVENLRAIRLTEEDFRDIREVQPFVLTGDNLWNYRVSYKGVEPIDGHACYVYRIQPKQVLHGQRLFDGLLWVSREHGQVVRVAGKPLPQLLGMDRENLFPNFTTVYESVDGEFWFPKQTLADDYLPFRTGFRRVRYTITFDNYKRFSAESTIVFDTEQTEP